MPCTSYAIKILKGIRASCHPTSKGDLDFSSVSYAINALTRRA